MMFYLQLVPAVGLKILLMPQKKLKKSMKVVSLSSLDGADLKSCSDVSICVDTEKTDRCQEVHATIIHSIINYIEKN